MKQLKSYLETNQKITYFILTILFFTFLTFFVIFHYYSTNAISLIKERETSNFKEILKKENLSIKNYITYQLNNENSILKKQLKQSINLGYEITNAIYFNEKSVGNDDKHIKKIIKETLRNIPFKEQLGYFFIENVNGIVEINTAFPQIEGKNFINLKDKNGFPFIKKVIENAVIGNNIFINYVWKYKDGTYKEKICYFKLFKPYNWIIGISVFYKDFEEQLKRKILENLKFKVLPSQFGSVVIDKNNKAILSININKQYKFNYDKFLDKNFSDITLNNQKFLYYATSIDKFKWKIVTLVSFDNIKKVVTSFKQEFHNKLIKFFYLGLFILITFISLITSYFFKLNHIFIDDFNKLINFVSTVTPNKKVKKENYYFKEQEIIYDKFTEIINSITEEKRIKETITEQLDRGIILLSHDLIIEYVNPFTINILGFDNNELLNKNFYETIKIFNIDTAREILPQNCIINKLFTENKKVVSSRTYILNRNNSLVPVSISFIAIKNKGKIEKIVVTFKDITTQIEKEKEYIEARNLAEKATEERENFVANISHEIRTPMNGIIGFVDLLLSTDINEKQKKYLEIIKESSETLLNLLNDILDFSKFHKNKIELEKRNFNISKMVIECCNTFTFKAQEKSIDLKCEVDENIPNTVKGDRYRLSQILNNLISNAIKFTPSGYVKVGTKLKEIGQRYVKIKFYVTDSGIGIPLEKQEKIFNAFTQADSSTTREFGGTGLGLSICKALIEKMGGKLELKSKPGKGTEFYFILEFEIGDEIIVDESHKKVGTSQSININSAKILFVEDDIFIQSFLKEVFTPVINNFKIAGNGKEALELILKEDFDIIFMDIEMPSLDGFQTVEIIRKFEKDKKPENIDIDLTDKLKNKHLNIIAMTGHTGEKIINKIFEKDFDDYLAKPYKITTILDKIKKYYTPKESSENLAENYNISDDFNYNELKELIEDEEILKKLMDSFIENFKINVKKLEKAVRDENFKEIYTIAHTLKGSSGNIKANKIFQMAKELELLEKKKDIEKIKEILKILKQYC